MCLLFSCEGLKDIIFSVDFLFAPFDCTLWQFLGSEPHRPLFRVVYSDLYMNIFRKYSSFGFFKYVAETQSFLKTWNRTTLVISMSATSNFELTRRFWLPEAGVWNQVQLFQHPPEDNLTCVVLYVHGSYRGTAPPHLHRLDAFIADG